MASQSKIILFHALLRETGTQENKGDMVGSFGKTSTKDLTEEEIGTLIDRLQDLKPASAEPSLQLRRARSTVLKLLNEMGIVGWDRINAYLDQPRIFGKRLNATTDVDETKALARKLRAIKNGYQKLKEEEDYLAANN